MHTQFSIHEADDYYKVLEVSRDATENEIKEAYHKMLRKHHPDKKLSGQENEILAKKSQGKSYSHKKRNKYHKLKIE